MRRGLLAFALVLLAVGAASASGPCTKGTDCYCDKVATGGSLADPNLLFCEDFEAPTLRNNQGLGNGAPYYGPPYDEGGVPGARGYGGYWNRKFGPGGQHTAWSSPNPTSPTVGSPCTFPLCYQGIWHPTNLWNANTETNGGGAVIAPLANGDFARDDATITPPTLPGGGAGVFDGNISLGHRIVPGQGSDISGNATWGADRRNVGMTMALGYASNIVASGILGLPWKHQEMNGGTEPFGVFHDGGGLTSTFPFYSFLFGAGFSLPVGTCQAVLDGATVTAGSFACNGIGLLWHPAPTGFDYKVGPVNYAQGTDFPPGTWGCVRAYYQNIALSNMAISVWFTGLSGVEKLVVGISGLNATWMMNAGGYGGFAWNSYSNQNATTTTSRTTFRYEDNHHWREGVPVSCGQIGYGVGGGITPPSAPTNLQVTTP